MKSRMLSLQNLTALFFCLLLAPSITLASDEDPQIREYSQLEIKVLKAGAEKGDAQSQLEYGKALISLRDNKKSHVSEPEIKLWLEKAAQQNIGEAWYWLGKNSTEEKIAETAYMHAAELAFAPAYTEVFYSTLFFAGEDADPVRAKYFLDLARKNNIKYPETTPGQFARIIDACYDAGPATVSNEDRAAINRDERASSFYTPNDNLIYAQAYANGWGVSQNKKRALAFACRGSNVVGEFESMVETLIESKDDTKEEEPFLYCDHVSSGATEGVCSAFAEGTENRRRKSFYKVVTGTFSPEQRHAFDALQRAAEAYFEEHARSEQDMTGSAREAIVAEEQARLRNEFEQQIRVIQGGKLPDHDPLPTADEDLNTAYRNILKKDHWIKRELTTVSPEGIRATQRLWLKYRDAWARFGVIRYPKTTSDDWKAWSTQQRTQEIKDIWTPDRFSS